MSALFRMAIFLKSFWLSHSFSPTEQQDMAPSNMFDSLFSGENIYLSRPHGWYPEWDQIYFGRPNVISFWNCKLPNIVILYWGHVFLFMCTDLFLVHTALLMVFITWFMPLSRTNTGTRSQIITQHCPKPKCRHMLNPKNKVQSLLIHQNMPDIQTRAVSAQNMGQVNF